MQNIDWDFIGELEGKRKLKGYVPDAKNSDSGVTIATGFDLGARKLSDLAGLPQDIIDVLTPYLGIKGAEAAEKAKGLNIDNSQAKVIDEFSHKESYDRLSSKWEAATGTSFSELPEHEATVIASVAFQYGDLASRTPNFWKQVTSGDWDGAVSNLRNFGDRYETRRKKEAEYFQKKRLDFTLSKTAPEDAPSRQLSNEELVKKVQGQIAASREPQAAPTTVGEEVDFEVSAKPLEIEDVLTDPAIKTPINTEIVDFDIAQTNQQRQFDEDFYDSSLAVDRSTKANSQLPKTKDIADSYTSLYGESGEVHGSRVQSKFGTQDEYDYAVFDETFENVWGAAFRQNNFIPALNRMLESADAQYAAVTGYDPFNDEKLKSQIGGSDGLWMFRHSSSPAESMLKLERMREDAEDMAFLAATDSTGAQVVASLASPTTALPLAPARVMKMASGSKRFVGGTAFTSAVLFPEQMLIESQNEYRDASHSALMLSALSLIGGGLTAKFGKGPVIADTPTGSGGEQIYRSAGANVSPERYRQSMYATMEQDALKETGIGLEKLPWNPVIRMLNSPNPFVRQIATGLVDVGGMMQKKVDEGLSMDHSVESTFRVKYLGPLRQAITESDKAYLAYRGKAASQSDIARSVQMLRTSVSDMFNNAGTQLTHVQFRNRVAKAMRRGDVDNIGDDASEFVTQAAQSYRKMFNLVKDEANKVRLFERQLETDLAKARAANDVNRIRQLEEAMVKLQEQGVTANNALSYVPRIFRVDKIMERSAEFLSIIERHAVNNMRMSRSAAKTYAQNVMDTVTRSRPYLDLDGAADQLDFVISPSGSKASTLNIPDDLLEEFIENDIETLLRHHVKTMGVDVELTARYGSIDMKSVIDDIVTDYQRLIDETADANKKAELTKKLERDLEDIRGLRDRVRGTYGASKDPHALSSRFIRVMKSFNVLVGMGGAMISSVPDVFRTTMVEGFKTTNEKGFKNLFVKQAGYVKALKQKELAAAGVAVDAVLGLRAHSFSDMGDLFGSRYTLERGLNQATGVFFMMNGLNYWNQALKEFAGNVTMLRMTDALTTTWEALSKSDKEKLLKNGIDRQDAYRMRKLIEKHGRNVDGQKLPNTDLWEDPTMRLKFRIALNQNVERIIITPGAGDRALWTSTEFGSMLTQFKSFGQGAMVRMATAGLQERDGAFWQGATLLVAMAGLVNEIKRAQYGIDDNETFDEKLLNAVDRSGVMGWAMDVNNAVEKLSDNKLGMRPFFTDQPQYNLPDTAKAGAVLGPTASNLMNISSVMGDVVTFNADKDTLKTGRFITPGSTLPYLDPIYDGVFGQ
jgi:hypothetical protein